MGDPEQNERFSRHVTFRDWQSYPEDKRDFIYTSGSKGGGLAARFLRAGSSFEPAPRRKSDTMRWRCVCGGFEITTPTLSAEDGKCCCASCCRTSAGLVWDCLEGEPGQVELPGHLASYGFRRYCKTCGALVAFLVPNGRIALSLTHLTDYTVYEPDPKATYMQVSILPSADSRSFTDDQRGLKFSRAEGAADGIFGLLKDDGLKRFGKFN